QYTANDFTKILEDKKIKISMDGKGRAVDNIFIERLWRTVKYEYAYIWMFDTIKELREGLKDYFDHYNNKREHQSLGYKTPSEVYGDITNVQTA
ncbi:MAG: transposase, partial [Vulcanibacillus sp.]